MKLYLLKRIILRTAVGRAVFRSGSSLSAVLSSLCYSRETHPAGSDSHGCLTLHFAKNANERRAESLKPAFPTAECRIIFVFLFFLLTFTFSLFTASYAGGPPQRIISLAPATTEMLFALGLGDRIVGVTSFCDYPDEARKKPKVGGMSNPSLEAVVSLKPDIVVLSVDGNPKEFEERLRSMKIRTYVFYSKRISELPKGIRDMGIALGAKEKAEALAADMEYRINKLRAGKNPSLKSKVLFIIWPEPLMVAGPGSITDDALQILGADNIAGKTASTYPKYSIEEVIRRAPDIIFIGKGRSSMNEVSEGLLRRLKSTPAARNNKVFYVSDYLYRLGPRTLQGIEELAGYVRQ